MNDPKQQQNYGFALLERLARTPNAVAFRSPGGEVTYGQLRAMTVRYAAHLGVRGVMRGSSVALAAERPVDGFALATALALLGARWVRRTSAVSYPTLGITHVVALEQPVVLPHANFIVVDASWKQLPPNVDATKPLGFPGYAAETDTAFYAQSSGTTGRPKFIAKSFSNVAALLPLLGRDRFTATFCAFPILSSVGFLTTLGALMRGATMVARADNVQQLEALGADRVLASPAQITHMIQRSPPLADRIRLLHAFGSMITPQAVGGWLRYFETIKLSYGSQEAWRGGEFLLSSVPGELDVAYEIFSDVQIETVDEAGATLPRGTAGIIRIKTPEMVHEYVEAPEATAEAFRDGWFYPGDLGALTADGRLRVFGRVKDQFNLGGVKANAADVDEAAKKAKGVETAISFTRMTPHGIEELCVLAKAEPGADLRDTAAEIRRACGKLRGKALIPSAIYYIDDIPLSDTGKADREEAAQLVKDLTIY